MQTYERVSSFAMHCRMHTYLCVYVLTSSLFAAQRRDSLRFVMVFPTAVTGWAARRAQAVQHCQHKLRSTVFTLVHFINRKVAMCNVSMALVAVCNGAPSAAQHFAIAQAMQLCKAAVQRCFNEMCYVPVAAP